jgi:hypothetical protein
MAFTESHGAMVRSELEENDTRENVSTFCGKGFFVFLFEKKVDRDLIFINGPYFMGSRGMYLNKWTLDFILENDIPSVVSVWVHLPFLPLHCLE